MLLSVFVKVAALLAAMHHGSHKRLGRLWPYCVDLRPRAGIELVRTDLIMIYSAPGKAPPPGYRARNVRRAVATSSSTSSGRKHGGDSLVH